MALALAIALALSISELLTKYKSYLLSNLFNAYLLVYLLLNGLFALVAYLLIPLVMKSVTVGSLEHSLLAGFGYAFVLRTKLMTITIGKQELAVGPELLYTGLMNYVSFHMDNKIHTKRDLVRQKLLKMFEPAELFSIGLNIKIAETPDASVQRDLAAARDEILNNKQMTDIEKTYGIARLLIDLQPDEKSLTLFLEGVKAKQDKLK